MAGAPRPRLQPVDVAGVTQQVALQGVAAVALLVVELQATVLWVGGATGQRAGSEQTNNTTPHLGHLGTLYLHAQVLGQQGAALAVCHLDMELC